MNIKYHVQNVKWYDILFKTNTRYLPSLITKYVPLEICYLIWEWWCFTVSKRITEVAISNIFMSSLLWAYPNMISYFLLIAIETYIRRNFIWKYAWHMKRCNVVISRMVGKITLNSNVMFYTHTYKIWTHKTTLRIYIFKYWILLRECMARVNLLGHNLNFWCASVIFKIVAIK